MGVMLSSPVELTRVQRKGSSSFRCAVAEMQGWRTSHEDAHDMYCDDRWGSFWVLDGHGGDGASIYCAPRLSEVVGKAPQGEDAKLPGNDLICQGFEGVDAEFRKHVCQFPDKDSGTTVTGAVVAKLQDGTYSAKLLNSGDSRGLVVAGPLHEESDTAGVRVKTPVHLAQHGAEQYSFPVLACTVDHKPDFPTEKERIEAAGGFVSQDDPPRLDGNLAVSRGLGDFEYKQHPTKPACDQKVSCVPDIYEVSGLKEGCVIVLACDGLWDVMTPTQVADIVRSHLRVKRTADLGVVCAELVHKALLDNSRDNVTVMIVQLTDGTDWVGKSNRFNTSDEMMYFDKLVGDAAIDEELRKQYRNFLTRCRFPTAPVQCTVTGRWFSEMWRCPGTGNVYVNKHYQKKGWPALKGAEASPPEQGQGREPEEEVW